MQILHLFTPAGRPLTSLRSSDETVTLPTKIHLHDDGRATACHPQYGDETYVSLYDLCGAYELDEIEVRGELEGEQWEKEEAAA
jgi:hypothetical protein